MKNYAKIALISVAFGTAVSAAPFLAIGDGAELFVTGTLGVRADDNIFTTDKPISDTIFDINPGVEITFGKDAALKGALTLVDSFANYSDNSNLNTNLFTGDFNAAFDDAKLKLKFNTGFHELNQNAPDIRGLTRRDQFVIGSGAEVEISQITSVAAGVDFDHTNYKRAGYGDSDTLTVPLNFYYKWTAKTSLSAGYRYKDYQTTVGLDSSDHYFNVGARGELFSEKLTGEVTAGVTTRKFSRGGDETLPGFDAKLTYEITPKTSLQLGGSNDFGTSPQGAQQKNLAFNAGLNVKLDDQWSLNGAVSARNIDYYTRTEDYIEASLGAGYTVNSYVKIAASYTHRNNSSPLAGGDFTQNVFSLAASLRY